MAPFGNNLRFTCSQCRGDMLVIRKGEEKTVLVCPKCQHTHLFKQPPQHKLSQREGRLLSKRVIEKEVNNNGSSSQRQEEKHTN